MGVRHGSIPLADHDEMVALGWAFDTEGGPVEVWPINLDVDEEPEPILSVAEIDELIKQQREAMQKAKFACKYLTELRARVVERGLKLEYEE